MTWRRTLMTVTAGLVLGLLTTLGPRPPLSEAARSVTTVTSVAWADGGLAGSPVTAGVRSGLTATLSSGPRAQVSVVVSGARIVGVPSSCQPSSIVDQTSWISEDATTLFCQLRRSGSPRNLAVSIDVDGAATVPLSGAVLINSARVDLPLRPTSPGGPVPTRELRLLSSPDFLNADVADLRRGPGFWNPSRSENGINDDYRQAIARVMDAWKAQGPDAVLVAGDLVDGRWGRDEFRTGTFGPVDTPAHRLAALHRAARTYYPAWLKRFRDRGLAVFPAIGDHEYGDDSWPASKRVLAGAFRSEFGRFFTSRPGGGFRFPDHPEGLHAQTAYAWRPSADVQVVSLDVFDIDRHYARIRLDRAQRKWLVGVLAKARRDGVEWTIVQGHTPIIGPVRSRASSNLSYAGHARSDLWRIFTRFDVDVYLCGEVHDVTATTRDGVLQLAHGGAFQYGLTNYALLDVYADRLQLTLNDVDLRTRDASDGSRLWETVREGMKKSVQIGPAPFTIGTLTLRADGSVTDRSGILAPLTGRPAQADARFAE